MQPLDIQFYLLWGIFIGVVYLCFFRHSFNNQKIDLPTSLSPKNRNLEPPSASELLEIKASLKALLEYLAVPENEIKIKIWETKYQLPRESFREIKDALINGKETEAKRNFCSLLVNKDQRKLINNEDFINQAMEELRSI